MTEAQEALMMRVEMKLDLLLLGAVGSPAITAPTQLLATQTNTRAKKGRDSLKFSLGRHLGKNFLHFINTEK